MLFRSAEDEPPDRIDLAVIEPVTRQSRLGRSNELACVRDEVVGVETALERDNNLVVVLGQGHGADLLPHVPHPEPAAVGVIAEDSTVLGVDPPQTPGPLMSSEEAVLQMNMLGHDFFVYTDAETEEFSIVYRRKDGRYGLIETAEL